MRVARHSSNQFMNCKFMLLSPCGAHKNYVYTNNKVVAKRTIFGGRTGEGTE